MERGDLTQNEIDALDAAGIDVDDFVEFSNSGGSDSTSGVAPGASADAIASANTSLAEQATLVGVNQEFMVAMAYFQMALAVAGKISGR